MGIDWCPGGKAGELVQRRWNRPGQNRRPVYDFRSENREFSSGRCLIVVDDGSKPPEVDVEFQILPGGRSLPGFCERR